MNTSKNVSKDIKAMQNGDKNRRTLVQVVVAVVLIALVAAIALFIVNKDSTSGDASSAAGSGATGAQLTPTTLTDNGAIRFGNPDATTVVSVVEDFQCPACKNFESISGSTLQQLAEAGNVAVDYRPISILDRFSNGTMYSTRAAGASICVAENDRDNWMSWHTAMFEQQPSEGGTGLTDDELVAIAASAGADSPAIASCITDGSYTDWVTTQTQSVLGEGINGTPNVRVNGTDISNPTPENILAAAAAAGN
ncbi:MULTISPECIES: DsbA family protein [unclassified Rhodococcus (in: high G+C Gram-positive bacteria)]|uniref:DsbA family protein n=1 Tax=unclassified Rhodococcus (in: high G+C Gram-positive bacteria) TaxID=192944 RepID=UPI00207B428B|nr:MULTISPECIES: thioredoxin domain-containing protein [unclassified Rhodococcus (in: high G+C Gram-positive bacteria)]